MRDGRRDPTTPGDRGTEPGVPEPPALYERFTVTYPSGTFIESFYASGATLREARVTHPMAIVEAVEASRVSAAEADRT
jgi:hypothetical protein